MKNPFRRKQEVKLLSQKQINRRYFISFAGFLGFNALAYSAWKWLYHSPKEVRGVTGGAHEPLRQAMENTESVFRKTFSSNHLVKTYPKSMAAKKVRVNSRIGMMGSEFDPAAWKLEVKKRDGSLLQISLDEIKALPKSEIVFDFKCVEGWDQIQYWAGVKFADFIEHYGLQNETQFEYVGMTTPDKKYYVGLDMPSAMHPQTILAYEMNDKPLLPQHGEPLRLIIPVKYGIKNLKRIGSISFSNQRPPDYWAERGYDYYSGLWKRIILSRLKTSGVYNLIFFAKATSSPLRLLFLYLTKISFFKYCAHGLSFCLNGNLFHKTKQNGKYISRSASKQHYKNKCSFSVFKIF